MYGVEPTPDANRANSSTAGSSIPIQPLDAEIALHQAVSDPFLSQQKHVNSHTNSNNISHRSQLRAFHEREEQHVENHISHYSRLQNPLPLLAHDENLHPAPEVRALTEPLPNEVKRQIASKMTPANIKRHFITYVLHFNFACRVCNARSQWLCFQQRLLIFTLNANLSRHTIKLLSPKQISKLFHSVTKVHRLQMD
jgi:hypothetical protein